MKRAFRCFLGRITQFQLQRILPWSCSAVRRLRLCISFSVKAKYHSQMHFWFQGSTAVSCWAGIQTLGNTSCEPNTDPAPSPPLLLIPGSHHKNRHTSTYFWVLVPAVEWQQQPWIEQMLNSQPQFDVSVTPRKSMESFRSFGIGQEWEQDWGL